MMKNIRDSKLAWRPIRLLATSFEEAGGIRKVRMPLAGRGKRGGARVIYYWAVRKDLILLLYMYPKSARADLSNGQIAQLARVVKEEFSDE